MVKLWKYIHYSEITKTIEEGEAVKVPLVWAVEKPDSEYDDITSTEKLYERECHLITERRKAGVKAYQEAQAQMRVDRLASGAPHSAFKTLVYDNMRSVIKNIESGDWLNAYEDMEVITVNEILTAEMKIGFRVKISTYLTESGNYDEFVGKSIDSRGYIIP